MTIDEGQITFELFGWEICLMFWFSIKPIFGGCFRRKRWLPPMFGGRFPGEIIDMAYAEVYCPIGGLAFEIWDHSKSERKGEDEYGGGDPGVHS